MTKNKPTTMSQETHPLGSSTSSIDIRILTHNIRYATTSPFPGEEPWSIRCPLLCSELLFNTILPSTFICLQEVLHSQLLDILSSLNSSSPASSPEWTYIGIGRDDGMQAGEYSPILYRPSTFKLASWETKWLSPTPSIPSKGWDASSIRIVTIAHFTHLASSRSISILNTHLDNEGSISRIEACKQILSYIQEFPEIESKKPGAVFLAGDFNSPPDDGAYKTMTSSESVMEDMGVGVPREMKYGNENTFTSFGVIDNEPVRIDFVFSRKGDKIEYRTFGVLENKFDDGIYLSDHRAVVADVSLL